MAPSVTRRGFSSPWHLLTSLLLAGACSPSESGRGPADRPDTVEVAGTETVEAAGTDLPDAAGAPDIQSDPGAEAREVDTPVACLTGRVCAADSDCEKAERCNQTLVPPACQTLYCAAEDEACDPALGDILCEPGLVCATGVPPSCCRRLCEGRACGDDGCGGTCGACGCGEACEQGTCAFVACEGRECGADRCGGTCGACPGAQDACVNGICVCQPACEGRECGADGCGGTCGTCGDDDDCEDGECVTPCATKGCDGECSAGVVEVGEFDPDCKPATTGCRDEYAQEILLGWFYGAHRYEMSPSTRNCDWRIWICESQFLCSELPCFCDPDCYQDIGLDEVVPLYPCADDGVCDFWCATGADPDCAGLDDGKYCNNGGG